MLLTGSKSEIMDLVSKGVLKMKNKNEYYIEAKPFSGGESHIILVSILETPTTHKAVEVVVETTVETGIKTTVEDFLKAFPTPTEAKSMLLPINGTLNRSLRSGNKIRMQTKINQFSIQNPEINIVELVKHEVRKRVKSSLSTNKNDLQFMQASEAWLNNDANIDILIDEVYNNKSDNSETEMDLNFV